MKTLDRLSKTLLGSPLSALALGAAVLIGGSAICEAYMATFGHATRTYFPVMNATILVGVAIWLVYLYRCLDFRWLYDEDTSRSHLPIRPAWTICFITSSMACVGIFFLFLTFEAAYIPKDPADFTWSFDMIRETLAKSGFTKWSIIINTSLTAIGSWFAVAEDEGSEKQFSQNHEISI